MPFLKPRDLPKRREPNPRILPDGRLIFKKPSEKWTAQRFKVFMRDNGRCVMPQADGTLCNRLLYFNSNDPFRNAEVDHIKTRGMGGANTDDRLEALRLACPDCHRIRHDKGETHGSNKGKKFPDRKKPACGACQRQFFIEIKSDLWEIFDLVAIKPGRMDKDIDALFTDEKPIVFVQTTSRNNHSTRRNKILGSMEAKLVLLSGASILIQSWGQKEAGGRWQVFDEWITLDHFKQARAYPDTVAELIEIRREEKRPDLPKGSSLPFDEAVKETPF